MSTPFTLRARDHLDHPDDKRAFNEHLFREVAPRYDLITRLLSFGRDAGWKRRLIADLPPLSPVRCLDLACGTGDLTRALARRFPRAEIVGLDLSVEMLTLARARGRVEESRIRYMQGDMQALPFEAESIDVVTGGYALRNAPDLDVALREIHRVLRPGGTLAVLDFSRSPVPARSCAQVALLKVWGDLWGVLLHGHADVYGYIAESLRRFPDRAALRERLRAAGLPVVRARVAMGGLIEQLQCRKA